MNEIYHLLDGNLPDGIDVETFARRLQTRFDAEGIPLQVQIVRRTSGIANLHLDADMKENIQRISETLLMET